MQTMLHELRNRLEAGIVLLAYAEPSRVGMGKHDLPSSSVGVTAMAATYETDVNIDVRVFLCFLLLSVCQ